LRQPGQLGSLMVSVSQAGKSRPAQPALRKVNGYHFFTGPAQRADQRHLSFSA
jgi:hypothetical protein